MVQVGDDSMPAKKTPMFQCQECDRTFNTVRGAEKARNNGCPKCGGCDIDFYGHGVSCDEVPDAPAKRDFIHPMNRHRM